MEESRFKNSSVALGQEIRTRREVLGYSQEAFAERVGVHRTYLGAVERGERNPALRNLLKIADALGCSLAELVNTIAPPEQVDADIQGVDSTIKDIVQLARRLSVNRLGVLLELTEALGCTIEENPNEGSDLVDARFLEDFSGRLLAYHAFHEEKLTKKTFEFVFCGASRAAGRNATITANAVNAGADVNVDGVLFSLKTQGAKSMSRSSITISKLMEARWIRECVSVNDFAQEAPKHIIAHLNEYDRILMLRAFGMSNCFEYNLIEIPVSILSSSIQSLSSHDFTELTKSGGSSASVNFDGTKAFTLRLDGSVEKVTISGLRVDLCVMHATWRVFT